MKRAFTIIKIIALVALVVAGVFGFVFARVWQQDSRPRDIDIRWLSNEARLGAPSVLRVEMKLPWNHRPASAQALRLPSAWVPQNGGTWKEGALGLNGYRQWSLESTLVPVTTAPALDNAIAWSLRTASGSKPRPVEVTMPPLTISAPTELAAQPKNPNTPLVYQPPVITSATAAPAATTRPWIWLVVAAVIAVIVWFGRRMSQRPAHVEPPWTRALASLNRLADAPLGEAQAYCTRLSDILKEYATQRFESNLVGASSTEFLRELASRHPLADEDKQALQATLGHADLVRFAGAELAQESATAALEHARRFVINTTPTPESDRA